MGEQDVEKLIEIENFTYLIPGFNFVADLGTYETAIIINGNGSVKKAEGTWNDITGDQELFCPDLLDLVNKKIIEYEEETGNRRRGAFLARKGHGHPGDLDTKRDEKRNKYYKLAGFEVLRIWESDKDWKKKVEIFLAGNRK